MRSLFLSSLVLLAGCSPQEMVERLVPPEDRVLATRYIDLLRSRSFEEIELAFDPSIAGPRLRETLFRLEGKSLLHYAVLGLVVALPIFTIYALVACFMTRMPGRKWAWALFILFGVGSVALNWTTGEWEFQPLRLQLLSASATAALYQPWVLSASFPLGAVIFLFRRRRLREPVTEPQQA